jgi:hypothetical protein
VVNAKNTELQRAQYAMQHPSRQGLRRLVFASSEGAENAAVTGAAARQDNTRNRIVSGICSSCSTIVGL